MLRFHNPKKYNLDGGFNDNIFKTGKIDMMPIDIFKNDYFYSKFSDELYDSFPGRTENDNPVVFIVSLKKQE